jgi:LDH2 family malate/lactate/ureidoglycolate dehydrogenase
MATSAEAWFGLVTANEEGREIPHNIAYDKEGNITTSPKDALDGALMVFDRSYKGSHLALMIELLAGALAGADMSNKWKSDNPNGSLIIAFDPNEFGSLERFQENVRIMCERVKNAKKLPGITEISLPGERSERIYDRNIELGTVELSCDLYDKLVNIATNTVISSDNPTMA